MPKIEIDYSNTIIYKITCKDPSIKDVYVGHTTNFVQRKHAHKQCCKNDKASNYKCKLYDVIRNNGGWENWNMEIINFFNCHDHYEARQKEQEYFILLNATLNSIEPMPKPKPKEMIVPKTIIKQTFYCDICNIHCDSKQTFEVHNKTTKHNKLFGNAGNANGNAGNADGNVNSCFNLQYQCKECNFYCQKKSNYIYHTYTKKHLIKVDGLIMEKKVNNYTCTCGKCYMSASGLWKHKKTCEINKVDNDNNTVTNIDSDGDDDDKTININDNEIANFDNEYCDNYTDTDNDTDNDYSVNTPTENLIISSTPPHKKTSEEFTMLTSLVMEVVKNNHEFQTQMFDMCKTMQSSITMNNNCNNNSNNTFNLQVFLNEECKDAINMSDFINSFTVELEDLENIRRLGYATGMSNMIVKELKLLDIYKRPIHCSDLRREIFYVKDNNVWERETPDNSNLKKAICGLSKKNMVKLSDWRDRYPECMDVESEYNNIYVKLMMEVCGGRGDQTLSENKIFKNIAKEVVITKKPNH